MVDDFLKVFEAKALASALTEAGHSVSERTVQRWKSGVTHPKPQDIRAIRELIGQTKEPPPEWAAAMEGRLTQELVKNRDLIEALARPEIWTVAERVIARLEALEPPSVEVPNGSDGGVDQDAAAPPDQAPESRPDQVPE